MALEPATGVMLRNSLVNCNVNGKSNVEVTYNTSLKYLGKEKSHILNSGVLIKIERGTVVVEKEEFHPCLPCSVIYHCFIVI